MVFAPNRFAAGAGIFKCVVVELGISNEQNTVCMKVEAAAPRESRHGEMHVLMYQGNQIRY